VDDPELDDPPHDASDTSNIAATGRGGRIAIPEWYAQTAFTGSSVML
jgi:hypothetical protein